MVKNKLLLIAVFVFCGLLFHALLFAYGLEVGVSAPAFKVYSGDRQVMTLEGIKGKATGIFYETRDVVTQNIELKNTLSKYYEAQPESSRQNMVRLPVINCSRVFKLLAGIWNAQLRKHSAIEGITIYADWSGEMFSDYNIKDGESNVFLIDKKGTIRYYNSGKIEGREIEKVVSLYKKLAEE